MLAPLGRTFRQSRCGVRSGRTCGTGILVERASWWNGHLGGTGILVERASWWNRHLGGTGILPVSSLGGLSRFPTPDSRFPIPDSRLPTPYSLYWNLLKSIK
ncbi:hypothetical protein [Moorena sp. SIO4A5]|uniref:hypothetical protein n=1 Tax=Moorena sp. SIO4A5 TaxID=2607838 RepID=UPI0013C88658|nr:hypothetical protein [Moorena sp. SIO4A5]NEO24128.1 hypothetical protein [Moorena sp. SIO4A5]